MAGVVVVVRDVVAVRVTKDIELATFEPPPPTEPPPPPPESHILGDMGAKRSGDEVEVSATDSPSLLHLESILRRFSFRS